MEDAVVQQFVSDVYSVRGDIVAVTEILDAFNDTHFPVAAPAPAEEPVVEAPSPVVAISDVPVPST